MLPAGFESGSLAVLRVLRIARAKQYEWQPGNDHDHDHRQPERIVAPEAIANRAGERCRDRGTREGEIEEAHHAAEEGLAEMARQDQTGEGEESAAAETEDDADCDQ